MQLHVENGATIVDRARWHAHRIGAGKPAFSAREKLRSLRPGSSENFSNLRGATSWQESRLVVGALTLLRGLDLDTITVDLSPSAKAGSGMEMHVDAFGGKIRARVSSDDRGDKRIWDVAGNGSGDFARPNVGRARLDEPGQRFPPRLQIHLPRRSDRSSQRDRLPLGGSERPDLARSHRRYRHDRRVALQPRGAGASSFIIKQRNNQLTLSGEFALAGKAGGLDQTGFPRRHFRFDQRSRRFRPALRLESSDFAGRLLANGSVSAREQKLGGQLIVFGNSLVLFRSPIESLDVNLGLEESRLAISAIRASPGRGFLSRRGRVCPRWAIVPTPPLSNFRAEYRRTTPVSFPAGRDRSILAAKRSSVDWNGSGANGTTRERLHARGRNLRAARIIDPAFRRGIRRRTIRPRISSFAQFHLWNQRADFSAFVTVAKDYFQLQRSRLSLNGQPRLQGNIFLPVVVREVSRQDSGWLACARLRPVLRCRSRARCDSTLAELAAAVKTQPKMSGQATGNIQLSWNTRCRFRADSEFHLRDFVFETPRRAWPRRRNAARSWHGQFQSKRRSESVPIQLKPKARCRCS